MRLCQNKMHTEFKISSLNILLYLTPNDIPCQSYVLDGDAEDFEPLVKLRSELSSKS